MQEIWIDPFFVHLMDDYSQVIGNDLGEQFIYLRDRILVLQSFAKLPLYGRIRGIGKRERKEVCDNFEVTL